MTRNLFYLTLLVALSLGAVPLNSAAEDMHKQPDTALSVLQESFIDLRFGLFLHFNMGTFVGLEWANGYEDPAVFAPSKLDCGQWADAARDAGMKYAVLTVKHTGGWCLWDSAYTSHDIAGFINYKSGKGDIVREFVDAFRARGLKIGLYYCFPGDYARPDIGRELPEGKPDLHGLPPEAEGDFVGFMKLQLAELLTNYGPIDLMWIDQHHNKYTNAQWPELRAFMKSLQPNCLILGNNARNLEDSDIVGYERPVLGKRNLPDDNTLPSEMCDTLHARGQWFWHEPATEDNVKTAKEVVDFLGFCNERHANLLLDVPPDREGLISGLYLQRMREIGALLRAATKADSTGGK